MVARSADSDVRGLRMTRRRVGIVLTVLALSLLSLALAEVGAFAVLSWRHHRIRQMLSPRAALSVYRDQPWAPDYWREHREAIVWPGAYRSFVGWRMPPYRGRAIVIDEQGRRRTEPSHCEGDAYTIDVFGGPTVWGYGVADWATIPSRLAERYAKAGRTVCVRNYGEIGWTSTPALIALVLELKWAPRRPDLVIFYQGCDDVLNPYVEGRVDVHANFREIKDWTQQQRRSGSPGLAYLDQTNIAELLRQIVAKKRGRLSSPLGPADLDRLAPEIVRNYLTTMDAVDALATKYGFRYEFFWQPVAFAEGKRLTAEEEWATQPPGGTSLGALPDFYRKTYGLVRAANRRHLHYLATALDDRRDTVYITMCHLSPDGNRLMAERIYEVVAGLPR
jgi:lysophospholipase L1-like esterase